MKRIIIICEGETEEEFCKKTLDSHFSSKEIYVQPINTKGIKPWESIKNIIEKKLKENNEVFVSTFYDYYGIHPNRKFPKWADSGKILDKNNRLTFIESEMKASIPLDLQRRFIPYLQLHEFEGLLFNNIDIFKNNIPTTELVGLKELEHIFTEYENPEMINDTPSNAPSYRLKRIINGYNKIVYGNILAETIGLHNIRSKCPRFNNWISTLENL